MPRKQDPRRRQRLLDAGIASLTRKGFGGTGVQEIAQQAGIPKGSFYAYFESKDAFTAEALRAYGAGFDTVLDDLLADDATDGLVVLSRFFDTMIARFERERYDGGCLVGNMAGEVAEDSAACRRAMAEVLTSWRARFAAVLARAQREGSARSDLGAEEMADFLINAWEGSLLRMKVERSTAPLEACRRLVVEDLFRKR